jgi:hypothetical protein
VLGLALALALALAFAGCGPSDAGGPVVIDLAAALDADRTAEITRTFAVDGTRDVVIHAGAAPIVLEGWVDGGELADVPAEQLAAGASAAWLAPHTATGEQAATVVADGEVTLTVSARGDVPPAATRERAVTWFDPVVLDDPSIVSFAGVMAAIADDGHGGALLDRWFRAFTEGPGAGRAAFAQFLAEVAAAQGAEPTAWDLAALPFRVTGVHNRVDLARGDDCGELRVSVASTHATFAPVHLIFLFRQPAGADDVTPDGAIHCRGAARRWARLAAVDAAAWPAVARALLADGLTRDRFLLAESVELTISPWQWRQWTPSGGSFTNPPLFQTLDLARVDTPGPTRDAFLADVAANADAIAARTWPVPAAFRAPTAEVQPTDVAALVDLSPLPEVLAAHPELPRALGMIGCPRCHTDSADFVQTGVDRNPSPFYDLEIDARAARLDALNAGAWLPHAPFGPLQPFP